MENNNCKDENESNKLSHDEREGLYQNEIIYYIFEKHMVEIINEIDKIDCSLVRPTYIKCCTGYVYFSVMKFIKDKNKQNEK